ncbi:MAG: TetR/AcrR family transcriptional regulator [Gaiellales bacterium]
MPTAVQPRLDRERIIAAARELVHDGGAGRLTMRRLGTALGVDPTAVYRHFANKDEILLALGEQLFADALADYAETASWRDDLSTLYRRGVQVYAQNPAIAEILARLTEELPVLQDGSEHIVRCLRRAGIADADLALMHHAVLDALVGAGFVAAVSVPHYDAATRDRLRRAYKSADPATHAAVVPIADDLFPDSGLIADTLLTTLLDGIEARAERTNRRPSRPSRRETRS